MGTGVAQQTYQNDGSEVANNHADSPKITAYIAFRDFAFQMTTILIKIRKWTARIQTLRPCRQEPS